MGFKRLRKVISRWVGFALLVAVALLAAGCGKDGGQGAAQGAVIATDGQVLGEGGKAFSLRQGDKVRICRSRYETELLRLTDKSIYEILRTKMTGGIGHEK